MKKFFKNIIDLIVIFPLFFVSLLKIILNLKKIYLSKIIVIQTEGGFGYNFTTPDIMRNFYKKKKLFILFFEPIRHNKYVNFFFDFDFLILYPCISFKFKDRIYRFGEYEGKKNRYFTKILILLIKFLTNKNSKVFKEQEIHDKLGKKNYLIKNKNEAWKDIYYYKVKKNNFSLKLNSKYLIELNKKFNFKKYKIINIYLRRRSVIGTKDFSISSRSGSKEKDYYPALKYLIKKKYIILITGDVKISEKIKNSYNKFIFDANDYMNKELISLYFSSISNYAIVEPGGGFWFGIYKKKVLKINGFPYGITLPGNKILFKNVIRKKDNYKMKKKWCEKNFKFKYNDAGYRVMPNSSKQILNFIKKNF